MAEYKSGTQLGDFMGIEAVSITPALGICKMPVAQNVQPMGRLAGGASILLCEGVASRAANAHAAGLRKIAFGLEVNATHHNGVSEGYVTATATAVHLGRTTASYEVAVVDERQRRITSARVTCILVDPPRKKDNELRAEG